MGLLKNKIIKKSKGERPYISISREDWLKFINNDCSRYEVNEDASDDYMRGFIKGVQVALLDLLYFSDINYNFYRDEVGVIEDRLREQFRPSNCEEEVEEDEF